MRTNLDTGEEYDDKQYVMKSIHDRQVEVLQNIIGAMLRMAGQAEFHSHIRELDGFGDNFNVITEVTEKGVVKIRTLRRGIVPAQAMPTIPFGHLKSYRERQ